MKLTPTIPEMFNLGLSLLRHQKNIVHITRLHTYSDRMKKGT